MFVPDCIVYTVSALLFIGRGDVVAGLDTIVFCLMNPARPRRLRDGTQPRELEEEESSGGEEGSENELDFEEDFEEGGEEGDDEEEEEEEKKKK